MLLDVCYRGNSNTISKPHACIDATIVPTEPLSVWQGLSIWHCGYTRVKLPYGTPFAAPVPLHPRKGHQPLNTGFKLNTEHTKPPGEGRLFRHGTNLQALSWPRLWQICENFACSVGIYVFGKAFIAYQQLPLVLGNLIMVMDRCIVEAAAFSRVGEYRALALDTSAWGRTSASGSNLLDRLVSQAVGRPLHGVSGCGHGYAKPLTPSLCIQTLPSQAFH